ncbi:MAG: IMPACT family protein [Thermoanaerobaculia bacterium]
MPADNFRTLAAQAEFRQKIERSEFLGIAFPVTADDAFFEELTKIEKRYFDATHHCWAFRLFADGNVRQRSSDAGEPSGTAGKPILSAVDGAALHDLGVVVVRWYGGVKLGSGGLTRAYRDTAAQTLAGATIAARYLYERFEVEVPFASMNVAYRLVDPPTVVLVGEEFAESNHFQFDVRTSRAEEFAGSLSERRLAFTRDPTPRLR